MSPYHPWFHYWLLPQWIHQILATPPDPEPVRSCSSPILQQSDPTAVRSYSSQVLQQPGPVTVMSCTSLQQSNPAAVRSLGKTLLILKSPLQRNFPSSPVAMKSVKPIRNHQQNSSLTFPASNQLHSYKYYIITYYNNFIRN